MLKVQRRDASQARLREPRYSFVSDLFITFPCSSSSSLSLSLSFSLPLPPSFDFLSFHRGFCLILECVVCLSVCLSLSLSLAVLQLSECFPTLLKGSELLLRDRMLGTFDGPAVINGQKPLILSRRPHRLLHHHHLLLLPLLLLLLLPLLVLFLLLLLSFACPGVPLNSRR